MDEKPRYWFPAKTYGWGWGLPTCWQGWAVIVGYLGLLWANAQWHPPSEYPIGYFVGVTALTLLLVAICWRVGEPPRWRWGK
mgnify:FL=1